MKRLVICCDGTWNTADQQHGEIPCPTNVIKLAFRVAKSDGLIKQFIFYDQGVGTGNFLDRITGGAFGTGLLDNIFDAYRFLIANYELGDELFVFGFSRGAYTARSLCGMMRKCGILRRESISQYRAALDLYRRTDCGPDDREPRSFRHDHSIGGDTPIEIKFVGVWDTVGSLGIPIRGLRWLTKREYQFHDTELSGVVGNAFQALAIDEHRSPFKPTLWSALPKPDQVVKQVWFCGAHSDVGGGYARPGLSDISLGWMIDSARSVGLTFDSEVMSNMPLGPDPTAKLHESKRGLYVLTAGINREIGLDTTASRTTSRQSEGLDATQSLHPSVLARWDTDPDYRPAALMEYFKITGDPRAGPGWIPLQRLPTVVPATSTDARPKGHVPASIAPSVKVESIRSELPGAVGSDALTKTEQR